MSHAQKPRRHAREPFRFQHDSGPTRVRPDPGQPLIASETERSSMSPLHWRSLLFRCASQLRFHTTPTGPTYFTFCTTKFFLSTKVINWLRLGPPEDTVAMCRRGELHRTSEPQHPHTVLMKSKQNGARDTLLGLSLPSFRQRWQGLVGEGAFLPRLVLLS